jgi:hypothetical protein
VSLGDVSGVEAYRNLDLVVGISATRNRDRVERRVGPKLLEERSHEARPHARSPRLQPGVAVVIALVFVAEFGGELEADDEMRLFAV